MSKSNAERFQQDRDGLVRAFFDHVPHNRALGIELIETGPGGRAVMRLPYQERLVGNPLRGILHGGAVTALMDACCGGAVFMGLTELKTAATLDLRIDYLRSAESGRDIIAEAECYHMGRNIAFARCHAYHAGEPEKLVASVAATFMIGHR